MYPRSNQSFPIFSHICQNGRLLGSGNARMLLNPKKLQQKVSMHFPTAQSLLNNILKICHWGIRENGLTMMLKKWLSTPEFPLLDFEV